MSLLQPIKSEGNNVPHYTDSLRAIISYLAAIELRHSGAKIASELRLSEKSVSRCIERGKTLVDNDKELLEYLQ